MMTKRLNCIMLLLSLYCATLTGQVCSVWGRVNDRLTHGDIMNVKVTVMDSLGHVVDSTRTEEIMTGGIRASTYRLRELKSGTYTFMFSHEGYEDAYCVHTFKFRPREHNRELPMQSLSRRPKEQKLGEAVVQATKLKFYTSGDTLVFNADAFETGGGNMLGSLLRQLPGVELRDDGRIFVNGKYVESLTLNGNGLFRDDNSIMLENLPSYMVKTVNVYEQERSMADRYMGRESGDRQLVMDIRLKRQYSKGYIGNTEWGYGTQDRYLGRLFLMRYTKASALTLVGSINNLDYKVSSGSGAAWQPDNLNSAKRTVRMGGFNYAVQDKVNSRWTVMGDLTAWHNDAGNQMTEVSSHLMTGGDTYGVLRDKTRDHEVSVSTSHNLFGISRNRRVSLWVAPKLNYTKFDHTLSSTSGTFGRDVFSLWGTAVFDSLRAMPLSAQVQSLLLNRVLNADLGEGHRLRLGGEADLDVKIPYCNDKLGLTFEGNYGDRSDRMWKQYILDYAHADGSFNREQFDRPQHDYDYKAAAKYTMELLGELNSPKCLLLDFDYNYNQAYVSDRRELYREMTDTVPGDAVWDALPSFTEWVLGSLERGNSYRSGTHSRGHKAGVRPFFRLRRDDGSQLSVGATLAVEANRRRLGYHRADGYDSSPVRRRTWFTPRAEVSYTFPGDKSNVHFLYKAQVLPVDMLLLVDTEDSSNPLLLQRGNPQLEDARIHMAELSYEWRNTELQRMFHTVLSYKRHTDAVAMSTRYDLATGISQFRPENVNGNYSVDLSGEWAQPVDRAKRSLLRIKVDGNCTRSVDLSTTEGLTASPLRSKVDNIGAMASADLSYRWSKVRLNFNASVRHNTLSSGRADFTNRHLTDCKAGGGVTWQLPWKLSLFTSVDYYGRYGYADAGDRKGDWVWNVQLTKNLVGEKLYLKLDGFDILGQLSSVTRTVNAQGVTQRWNSTLPRYFMARLIYVLDIRPKR